MFFTSFIKLFHHWTWKAAHCAHKHMCNECADPSAGPLTQVWLLSAINRCSWRVCANLCLREILCFPLSIIVLFANAESVDVRSSRLAVCMYKFSCRLPLNAITDDILHLCVPGLQSNDTLTHLGTLPFDRSFFDELNSSFAPSWSSDLGFVMFDRKPHGPITRHTNIGSCSQNLIIARPTVLFGLQICHQNRCSSRQSWVRCQIEQTGQAS